MGKSIKLKNDIYLDSKEGIKIKRLYPTFNDEYVYTNQDFGYFCFQIGKLVFLYICTIAFKKDVPNYTKFISGLPLSNEYIITYLTGSHTIPPIRVGLSYDGIQTHWTTVEYGDSPNKQYSGLIIYETIE